MPPGAARLVLGTDLAFDPAPLVHRHGGAWTWAGPVISAGVIAAVIFQLRGFQLGRLVDRLPASPAFWIAFAGFYLGVPLSEWIIFRRLWNFPLSGLSALLRKQVCNELLLGYSGEIFFYSWARRHRCVSAAPFAAVKDVSILSALVGNAAALILVLVAAPYFDLLPLGHQDGLARASIIALLASSGAAALWQRHLFALSAAELGFVALVHATRIGAMLLLAIFLWHCILPDVAFAWWLVLAMLRLLLSRLPFVPNKDLVFTGFVAMAIGREAMIIAALALLAGLFLLTHALLGAVLGGTDLLAEGRHWLGRKGRPTWPRHADR